MSHYNCLLIDLDNTLLDFDAAEAAALPEAFARFEVPFNSETLAQYREINDGLWHEYEAGRIREDKLFGQRFTLLLGALGRTGAKGDGARMNDCYFEALAKQGQIVPGADEFLADVEDFVTIAVITNGSARVQASRLEASGLGAYADGIFVSEKVGISKPDKRFANLALEKLGISNRARVLVVGDSLTADVGCGRAAGLDTCWCNFGQAPDEVEPKPTYTVHGFEELKAVILEKEELDHVGEKKKYQL